MSRPKGPTKRRRAQALAITLTLAASPALPATALAQSAGDEQYRDPLAGEEQGGGQQEPQSDPGSGSGSGNQGATPQTQPQTQDQAQTQPSTGSGTTGQSGSGSGATAGSAQLPRTGTDMPVVLAAAGAGLLSGGALLRWRVRGRRVA